MGLGYTHQRTIQLIGSRSTTTITTEQLESTYHADTIKSFKTAGLTKANFNIRYTMGSGETSNSLELRFETSPDGNVWHQIVNEAVSGGTSTLTAREFTIVGANAANKDFSLPLDLQDEWMRVAAKETGVASTKGSVFIEVTLSGEK